MATTKEYIEYVYEQIDFFTDVRYKKMFGEYMLYVNEKPILLICDNVTYVKKLECLSKIMENADCGIPYNGAKEHYVLNTDDRDLFYKAIIELEKVTPVRKKK